MDGFTLEREIVVIQVLVESFTLLGKVEVGRFIGERTYIPMP